ncbi:uncharacterized protein LOC121369011 [Gigantopelta aegis]|uniref:uncharacterized protein LOC121369011 n=1 Tax=Gigantopelta aegis TaxID=1735272 RepID=UPI001B88A38F|nr:uncharacterized protein LOC121369011 [Gigantopelta aegis]
MAAPVEVFVPTLKSLPNFRILSAKYQTCCNSYKGIIYRSSRPDFIDENDVMSLKKLGINSIIDLRSRTEYTSADGDKLLDLSFQLYKVKIIHGRNYRPLEGVKTEKLDSITTSNYCQNKNALCNCKCDSTDCKEDMGCNINGQPQMSPDIKKPELCSMGSDVDNVTAQHSQHSIASSVFKEHYLINMFPWAYLWTLLARVPWYIQLMSLMYLLVDVIFNTGYMYILRFCAHYFLNDNGLIGQYRDTIDICQKGVCAALKLMTNPDNLPALLNCAIGKDRTGIVSALVLHCLGQSKEFIAKDYAKSAAGLEPVKDRIRNEVVVRLSLSDDFISAKEETMLQLLQYIEDKYGSITNYLEFIGFGSTEQEKLRQLAGIAVLKETESYVGSI